MTDVFASGTILFLIYLLFRSFTCLFQKDPPVPSTIRLQASAANSLEKSETRQLESLITSRHETNCFTPDFIGANEKIVEMVLLGIRGTLSTTFSNAFGTMAEEATRQLDKDCKRWPIWKCKQCHKILVVNGSKLLSRSLVNFYYLVSLNIPHPCNNWRSFLATIFNICAMLSLAIHAAPTLCVMLHVTYRNQPRHPYLECLIHWNFIDGFGPVFSS